MWWTAVRSGVLAAITGAGTAVVVAVLCWLPAAGVKGHPGSAIRAGLLSFLAAQHGGITVDGVSVGFLPLGLSVVVAIIAWRAGRNLAEAAEIDAQAAPGKLLGALGLAALAYGVLCLALVPVSRLGTSHASPVWAPISGFLLFTLVAGWSFGRGSELSIRFAARVPAILPSAARGAAAAVVTYLGAGALLVVGSLLVHAHRVTTVAQELGGGFSGLPILLIGVLCAPNAAIAGSAYLIGPGFAVGSGTTVNAFSVSHGVLPAFPLLGAVPDGRGGSIVVALMALTALTAGVNVARCIRRGRLLGFWTAVRSALLSGALTGGAMAVLAWAAGGRAGTGRLRAVGASPWAVGLLGAVTITLVALAALGAWAARDRLFRRPVVAVPAPERLLAGSAAGHSPS